MKRADTPKRYLRYGWEALKVTASSLRAEPWSRVWYVVEPHDWSVRWDGHYIAREARRAGVDVRPTIIPRGVRSQVVHYGSRALFLYGKRLRCADSNKVAFTWFHGNERDTSPRNRQMIDALPGAFERADLVVTSCRTSATRLTGWGAPAERLRVVPLGVDTSAFTPVTPDSKFKMRERLGIRHEAFCIGSFQKDGEGWGDGEEPKYVKAPEVFVETVSRLAKRLPVHVLLTGPARGFVKSGLERAGVPFTHVELADFRMVPSFYHCLDLYLITSRDEGGPKGLLEAAASGVPVVSTRMGMPADIVIHGQNGALANVDDVQGLASVAEWLAGDAVARERIALNGRMLAERHDWRQIGQRYADEVYRPLLDAGRSGRESFTSGPEVGHAA